MPGPDTSPRMKICDGSGRVLDTIQAESKAFLRWRKAWAKQNRMGARDVALVLHLEPQTPMLIDTGRSLARLQTFLQPSEATFDCEVVTRGKCSARRRIHRVSSQSNNFRIVIRTWSVV